jgi:hypothetical protein
LQKNGEFDKLLSEHDLSLVHAINDHEIEVAIDELKRSTAAIEKQTETLRAQQDGMSRLVKSNRESRDARSRIEDMQQRRWATEKAQITNAVSRSARAYEIIRANYTVGRVV